MSSDIWSALSKKKKGQAVTIPEKKTNNTTSSAQTATTTTAQPKPIKPPRVKPHKVQKHKAQKMNAQPQQQPLLSDFRLATTGDSTGVHIAVLYRDRPVHQFSLLRADYGLWQRLTPQQKYDYVRIRTNTNVFNNDMNIINAVINGTINVLNTLFAQAQQAHKRSMF